MEKSPQCVICGTIQRLLRCSKCKSVFYCSTAHQHIDWPKHKQTCRILSKQRHNNKIAHTPQSPITTVNTSNKTLQTSKESEVDAGHHISELPIYSTGIIGFGLLGGNESAEVDPSILMAVPPISERTCNNQNASFHNHSDIHDDTTAATTVWQKSTNDSSNLLPQYHHVDQRLLSPQYHLQQQLLMQQQLQGEPKPPPEPTYSKVTSISNHNGLHHYEKSFSCQVGSGGGMDENAFGNAKKEKEKIGPSGGASSDWPLYTEMHQLLAPYKSYNAEDLVEDSIYENVEILETAAESPATQSDISPTLSSARSSPAPSSSATTRSSGKKSFQIKLLDKIDRIEKEMEKTNKELEKNDIELKECNKAFLESEMKKNQILEEYVNDNKEVNKAIIDFLRRE